MEEYLKTMLGKIDTSLIAKITKVHSNGFVDVEPVAEYKDVMLPPILHVPMCQLGNRHINIKVNFKSGDIIPVLICSRDISGYISKEVSIANTNKRHNLTNAIALPMLISTDINNINIVESIEFNGDVTLNGNLKINGNATISGSLTVGEVKAKSVDTESGVSKGGVPYTHP